MRARIGIALLLTLSASCGSAPPPVVQPACPEPAPPSAPVVEAPPAPESTEMVVLDGTPEIPPELHERLQQYLETRTATVRDIAADGSSILITTRFANTSQLHELVMPMGARRQVTFGDEPVFGASYVPNDPHSLLVQADVGGNENYQLFRLDRRTGERTRLTDGVHRQPQFLFTPDGSRLVYTSNARNGTDMDLWISDGHGPGELFLERQGDWQILDFSRDGARLLIQQYVSITEQRLFVVDVATRAISMELSTQPSADRTATFSPDGNHLYFTSDRGGQFVQLYDYDLRDLARTTARPETIRSLTASIPWNVEDVSVSPDSRTVAFTVNEDGVSVLRFYDVRSQRITAASGLPSGVISGMRFADEVGVLAFSVTSSALSGDAFTYDLRRRALTRWTESEMGGLDPATFIEPTLVHFTAADGREIPCFYYRPRGEGPFPVMISIHGGPEAQARPWFYPLVQFLAVEEHVAVLMPNVRGSDGYGRDYLALDDGPRREDSVRDIGSLLDWIATQRELDAQRVAVYGGSYGGYMVLASLTHFSDRLRAGIDVVGIANFVTFLENTASYRRDLRRVEYGDESDPEMRRVLAEISPITHVDRIGTSLFVAHGANDPRVPAGEAEQIVHAVRDAGHEVWYMLARNEGHGFIRKENRDTFTELAVLFLERQLGLRTE